MPENPIPLLIQSVLVGAGASVHLPVRCVEQGRWGGDGTQRVHERKAPLGVQGACRGLRKHRPTADRVDQGDVWSRVATYEQAYGASATSSIVEVLDQVDVPATVRAQVPVPLPGQTGVLVGVGGHPAVLELFEHPDSLAAQWDAIVDGLLRSTLQVPTVPTPGRRARAFVRRLSYRPTRAVAAAGDGMLAEVVDDRLHPLALHRRRPPRPHGGAQRPPRPGAGGLNDFVAAERARALAWEHATAILPPGGEPLSDAVPGRPTAHGNAAHCCATTG